MTMSIPRQPVSINPGQGGFTLIEVLACIGIFAIGILAVVSVQTKAMNVDTHSRLLTDAYKVASDQVEDMLRWDFTTVGLDLNDTGNPEYNLGVTGPGNRHSLSYIVSDPGVPNMKRVTVEVEITKSSLDPVQIEFMRTPIQDIYQ